MIVLISIRFLRIFVLLQFVIGKIKADWGSADSSQYHIQTDEGPERFFRYQTDSGQFRNEKRLKDGTVIGIFSKFFFPNFIARKCEFQWDLI